MSLTHICHDCQVAVFRIVQRGNFFYKNIDIIHKNERGVGLLKKNMRKIIALVLTTVMILCASTVAIAADQAIQIGGGNYTVTDTPVFVKRGSTAEITLNNAVISSSLPGVEIEQGAAVTLILKGTSTIQVNAASQKAGIHVHTGASLTIQGDGTLNVLGGKYSAGIGSTYEEIPGDIRIVSGNINTMGGDRGAGIGSGYHASAGNVLIDGGNIRAVGGWAGAGIGTGYGTSGGGEGKVGFFNGGNITINGGVVCASAFDIDFSIIDPMNPSILKDYDNNGFAAGIGGGYGSASGNININGGKVTAIGSCGGAGIGSGRGTSKAANYDAALFFSNINITGNAEVLAMATDDTRNNQGGGAAIGTGRGTHTGGIISITGNAKVTAVASPYSAAIGAGSNPSPVDHSQPSAENITITQGVTLYAVSDGSRYAVDTALGTKTYSGISENIQQILFAANVLNADGETEFEFIVNGSAERTLTVPKGMHSVAVNVDKAAIYYLKSGDLFGYTNTDSFEYKTAGTLAESNCVRLDKADIPVNPSNRVTVKVVTPKRMSIRLSDGTVLVNGDSLNIAVGETIVFQMCSNNWDNNTYDDNGNGLAGTVVYRFKVSDSYTERSYDPELRLYTAPKGDPVLRTDTNTYFMAYRYYFVKGDYNKQTGISQVVNNPLEALSVNLPLGSTIDSDAYIGRIFKDTAKVFIETADDKTISYKDYNWQY